MENTKKYIFDLDGTLYSFNNRENEPAGFSGSLFAKQLKNRIILYVASQLNVDQDTSREIVQAVSQQFNGELSIGLEKVYGIDRYEYYAATWNCEPATYIAKNNELSGQLDEFRGNATLLTAAPAIWAKSALGFLGIADIFGQKLITGEPDIRKPNPQAFLQAAALLDSPPEQIIAIGDQNYSDIVPARSLGMTTILIGPERLDADFQAKSIQDAIKIAKEIAL